MPKRRYQMRINLKEDKQNYHRATVSVSDETAEMFTSPYYSVKRMQDRLAFVPWDKKAEQGTTLFSANLLRFTKQEDCEKMRDFCGQYYLVNRTENGTVFVKLEDRHPFDREYTDVKKRTIDTCTINPVAAPTTESLADVLERKIQEKQEDVDRAAEEVQAAQNLLEEAKEKLDRLSAELSAYYTVLHMERGDG